MGYLFRKLKAAWVFFWAAFSSVLLFVPITASALLSRTGHLAFWFCKWWVWIGLRIAFVRLEVRGREKVARGQSYVIVSNHQSLYDIPALMIGLRMQFRWVIKKELLYVPLFGYALYASRNIFIDRRNTQKAITSMDRAMARLPKGVSVMVFAEGTRSPDGQVQPFKKGAFYMATSRGIPILPVTVNGSHKVMPDKSSMSFNPGPIEIVIGDPIETTGYDRKNIGELIAKARSAIMANLNLDYPEKRRAEMPAVSIEEKVRQEIPVS